MIDTWYAVGSLITLFREGNFSALHPAPQHSDGEDLLSGASGSAVVVQDLECENASVRMQSHWTNT